MRHLFVFIAVFLSSAHALPFHLLPPKGAHELPQESCGAGIAEATLISVPVQKCYYLPQPYLQAFIQLEAQLVSLGYNEIQHLTEPKLIMSRWKETKAPQQQVTVFVAATRDPLAGSSLTVIDQTALQKMVAASLGDKALPVEKKPAETWSKGLMQVLEQNHQRTKVQSTKFQITLKQDKRISLPREAVEIPSSVCKKALRQTVQTEYQLIPVDQPFFGCYHFPQTFTQVRRYLEPQLAALGYQEGWVQEALGFNFTSWLDTEITESKFGTVITYSEAAGGSLFFELDYTGQ